MTMHTIVVTFECGTTKKFKLTSYAAAMDLSPIVVGNIQVKLVNVFNERDQPVARFLTC